MRATLILILLLCHTWIAVGLPVHHSPQISSLAWPMLLPSIHVESEFQTLKCRLGWSRRSQKMDSIDDNTNSTSESTFHRIKSYRQILHEMWVFTLHGLSLDRTSSPQRPRVAHDSSLPSIKSVRPEAVNYDAATRLSSRVIQTLTGDVSKNSLTEATSVMRSHRPYGTYLPTSNPTPVSRGTIAPFRRPNLTEHIARKIIQMDVASFCNEFSLEIIGLGIFMLVPTAVLIVEMVDMLRRWWTPEQFPQRGRRRVKLTGPERHFNTLAAWEREKMAAQQSQKWWWKHERGGR